MEKCIKNFTCISPIPQTGITHSILRMIPSAAISRCEEKESRRTPAVLSIAADPTAFATEEPLSLCDADEAAPKPCCCAAPSLARAVPVPAAPAQMKLPLQPSFQGQSHCTHSPALVPLCFPRNQCDHIHPPEPVLPWALSSGVPFHS